MIDRTVPVHTLTMRCPWDKVESCPEPRLPEGYSFALYRPGMGADWADICFDAGLFDSLADALSLFNRDFLPHMGDMEKRMWFVLDSEGKPVATASAWYNVVKGERMGMIHWVAARPSEQGKGIGRAVVVKVLSEFQKLEPGARACLDTGTPNWHAICLYHSLGFRAIVKDEDPDGLRRVAETLSDRMPKEELRKLTEAIPDFIV